VKQCIKCGIEKSPDRFEKKPKSKIQYQGTDRISTCRSCKHLARNESISRTVSSYLKHLIVQSKSVRKKQGYDYELTIDDLLQIYDNQDGRCAITGAFMFWKKNAVEMRDINMSIDRKDNNKGYTKDNVQLVCYRINMLRGGMDLDRFKEIISWIRGEDIFSPYNLKRGAADLKGAL
jgi:hypothetical protein